MPKAGRGRSFELRELRIVLGAFAVILVLQFSQLSFWLNQCFDSFDVHFLSSHW